MMQVAARVAGNDQLDVLSDFNNRRKQNVTNEPLHQLKYSLEEQGVRYCLPSYVDIHGVSKSKFVPIAHFDRMMGGSELCTGAALDGIPQDVSDEEVSSHPDPESLIILPWRKDVAWFVGVIS
mgnify:FL=1